MPKGFAKAGFRMTKKRLAAGFLPGPVAEPAPVVFETDDQIRTKLAERFAALSLLSTETIMGRQKALIISGPAGLGKSYTVMEQASAVENERTVTVVKGFVRATGLYKILYENRSSKCTIVFDDADSIFNDDTCLNLLKGACDMTRTRNLSWLAETNMETEEGEKLPRFFEFEGSIVFITNYDFDALISKGNKMAPHFEAMISRSMYLDLAMKTKRDYVIRIQEVVKAGMLADAGISKADTAEILDFIEVNTDRLRELSLRMVLKLASLVKINRSNWKSLARVTCMKGAN